MTNPQTQGYLENPYLDEEPYLGGTAQHSFGMETKLLIVDRQKPVAMEVRNVIADYQKSVAMEVSRSIVDYPKPIGIEVLAGLFGQTQMAAEINQIIGDASETLGIEVERVMIKDHALGCEIQLIMKKDSPIGFEVEARFLDQLDYVALQSEMTVLAQKPMGMETHRIIKNRLKANAAQSKGYINDKAKSMGFEVRMDKTFPHISCEGLGYLNQGYLETPYLAGGYCVAGPMEVRLILKKDAPIGVEVQRIIEALTFTASQIRNQIKDHLKAIGMEVERVRAYSLGMQIKFILYNNYNLRVLYEFPSRGISGINWTATSTATGDFSVSNLNTDIVEQRWQSANGDKFVILVCDTQKTQGVAVDTLAILNHNITTSASVVFEGSNFSDFSTVGESIPITIVRNQDIYYIAPTYPNKQYRYWRLIISDSTNPDNHISIGTIVFGSTIVLQGECFVDQVRKRKIHFSDKVNTEGFTNVSNDRALKKAINLDFQKLSYGRGNYENLVYVFDYARTSLKCLWIPDSTDPARFAVFGKLSTMPEETHLNMGEGADYVDFSIEVDESL